MCEAVPGLADELGPEAEPPSTAPAPPRTRPKVRSKVTGRYMKAGEEEKLTNPLEIISKVSLIQQAWRIMFYSISLFPTLVLRDFLLRFPSPSPKPRMEECRDEHKGWIVERYGAMAG